MEKVKKLNENPLIVPKMFRRDVRMLKKYRRGYKMTSKGNPSGSSKFVPVGNGFWGSGAIFTPQRKKLKGWQKK